MLDAAIDQVQLNFSPESLLFMNISLGIIMFGVALDIKIEHFKSLFKAPKIALTGLCTQYLILPAFTFFIVWLIQPQASIALGMILLAACPGGNISNFMSAFAKGNAALSVSLTAFATLFAVFLTPLNFKFWSSYYGPAKNLLQDIEIPFWDMLETILLLLIVPLILGMLCAKFMPQFTIKIKKWIGQLSILIFAAFVVVAFYKNYEYFTAYVGHVFMLIMIMNWGALLIGYYFAKAIGLKENNCRTISLETGIQNSGLGLILIFNFFDGLGGMAVVAGWWSIWHITMGLSLAKYWSNKPLNDV